MTSGISNDESIGDLFDDLPDQTDDSGELFFAKLQLFSLMNGHNQAISVSLTATRKKLILLCVGEVNFYLEHGTL